MMKLILRYYIKDNQKKGSTFATVQKEIELPFMPFIGLYLYEEDCKIESLSWIDGQLVAGKQFETWEPEDRLRNFINEGWQKL